MVGGIIENMKAPYVPGDHEIRDIHGHEGGCDRIFLCSIVGLENGRTPILP